MDAPTQPKTKAQKNLEKKQRRKQNRQTQREQNQRFEKLQTVRRQLLSTTELLEMILLHLPLKDLLLAQRVSAKWRAVIDNSQTLRKALFFQPATSQIAFIHGANSLYPQSRLHDIYRLNAFYLCPSDEAHVAIADRIETCIIKPRSLASPPSSEYLAQIEQDRDALRRVVSATRVFLNPLVLSRFSWCQYIFSDRYEYSSPNFNKGKAKRALSLPGSAKRPEASWRRMLITQPPLAAMTVRINNEHRFNFTAEQDLSKPVRMEKLWASLKSSTLFRTKVYSYHAFETLQDGTNLMTIKMGKTIEQEEADSVSETAKLNYMSNPLANIDWKMVRAYFAVEN